MSAGLFKCSALIEAAGYLYVDWFRPSQTLPKSMLHEMTVTFIMCQYCMILQRRFCIRKIARVTEIIKQKERSPSSIARFVKKYVI